MVMKKALSISFALLILLAGLHLTIATHICGGKIAQVKVSFSGKKGTCGMENNIDHKSLPLGFSSHCCDNESSVFAVEESYSPKIIQILNLVVHLSITPFIVLSESFAYSNPVNSIITNGSPPGYNLVHALSLTFICVFRN
jgi:hypothetical protein